MKVRPLLESIPNSWWVKIEAGAVGGTPDILGTVGGKFVALELKTSAGKVTALQEYTLFKIQKAGGFARVLRPENLDEILGELRRL